MKRYIITTIVLAVLLPLCAAAQYNPDVFALESGRGKLAEEYFGVKLADVEKQNGRYVLTDAQRKTIEDNILGRHMCSLQWISWTDFGTVTFSRKEDGSIVCKGGQKSKDNDDYLTIDGVVTVVSPLHIRITGTIVTCGSYINGGRPVTRKGTYNFTIAGARRYWRMREMSNPVNKIYTDYVDIYF